MAEEGVNLSVTVELSVVQPLSLLRRQGRVAAPSVCCAAACILLAAAPTATPCFRRWRRSSPLPLVGEPLAEPFTLRGLPRPLLQGEVARRRRDGEVVLRRACPLQRVLPCKLSAQRLTFAGNRVY